MSFARLAALLLILMLPAVRSWAGRIVPVKTTATFTAQQSRPRWSVPIHARDGHLAYILSLKPEFDDGGRVIAVDLVMRNPDVKGDVPDLIRESITGLQPPRFTANDLEQRLQRSALREMATLFLTKVAILLRVGVAAATVNRIPNADGYQIDSLSLDIEIDNLYKVPQLSLETPCSQVEAIGYTRPMFFERRGGVAYGITASSENFKKGDNMQLYILLSNESNHLIERVVCCQFTFQNEIEVVNSSGSRVPSQRDLYNHKTKPELEDCSCSAILQLPSGFCGVVDAGSLNAAYDLPPGTYKIIQDGMPSHSISEAGEQLPPGRHKAFVITVEPTD